MLIGINNSVLYTDYLQKVNNKVITYCLCLFFHTRPQALAQFNAKSNVSHSNEKGYAKEYKDLYRLELQGWPLQYQTNIILRTN